jgi:uncharacterized damage-inducible protein DinB
MKLTDILTKEAETTYTITEKLFHHVSNNQLMWMPPIGKNWMSMGQLLMHCSNYGCGKAITGFVKGDWGLADGTAIEDLSAENHVPPSSELPSVNSVEEAFDLLEDDKRLALKCIAEVDETKLLDKAFVAPWGGPEQYLFHHLLQMIAHLTHHKGQLFYYLKLMGENVNTYDLWGGS